MSVHSNHQMLEPLDPGREALAELGEKVDLDELAQAAAELRRVLDAHARREMQRLPASLTETQRDDLRAFVTETLERNERSQNADHVWRLIDPQLAPPVGPHGAPLIAKDVVAVLLDELLKSIVAVELLERLRG